MVRVFYVDCPECGMTFHAHHGELRGTDIELLCPACGHRFVDEESPKIIE